MLTATAEMTDRELNKLAVDTLAEMGESSPTLLEMPSQEETAVDDSQAPLSWLPRGSWIWRHGNPAELGSNSDGCATLTLSIATSRPPMLGELGTVANDTDDKARADALARLQATSEWSTYLEAKSEHASVTHRLDALEKEGREIEAERLNLAAKPKGQGKRLAEIQTRQGEIGREKYEVGLELQALQPILNESRQKAQAQAGALALETVNDIREQQQQSLDDALADFYRRHSDELTALAERLAARSRRRHDTWVATIKSFILSRMETANPLIEL